LPRAGKGILVAENRTFQQCLAAFVQGDYEKAVEGAYQLFEEGAGHEILQILLISLQRLGRSEELGRISPQAVAVTRQHPWFFSLVRLTLGEVPPAEVVAMAADSTQRCQAHYYAAARFTTLAQQAAARVELDACLAVESDCVEHQLAAALRRRARGSDGRPPTARVDPTEVFRRCTTLFIGSDYEGCVETARTLMPTAAFRSDMAQLVLISLQRLAQTEGLERFASQVLSATAGHPWFHGLVRLTLGEAEIADVLRLAKNDLQRCQAHYYAGARLLTIGRPQDAREQFDACLAVKVDCPEYTLASVEKLHPLDGPATPGQKRKRPTLAGGE
jgi:hypothetical protein